MFTIHWSRYSPIDSNGIVLCRNQTAFACLSENCKCNDLRDLLHDVLVIGYGDSNVVVHISDKAILSSGVQL